MRKECRLKWGPSYCVRIMALDVLSECGLGYTELVVATWPGFDGWPASQILAALRVALESELRANLGATLRQTRYRCRTILRRSQISRQVRLGAAGPQGFSAGREGTGETRDGLEPVRRLCQWSRTRHRVSRLTSAAHPVFSPFD